MPIFGQLVEFINPRHHEAIRRVVLDVDTPDRLVFKLSEQGDFSSKIYSEAIRAKGVKRA